MRFAAETVAGKPCRICQSTERYVSTGRCQKCMVRHMQKYRSRKEAETDAQPREAKAA